MRTPTAGRHAELLRLASSVGNRRMAQIARQPYPWYGPPMLGDEEEEEDLTGFTAPPGLDLGFLDDPIPSPPPLTIHIPPPAAQHATITPAPVMQQATAQQMPAPQQAVHQPAPVAPAVAVAAPVVAAPVAPAPVAPAPAPSRINELNGLDDGAKIHQLLAKVDELLGARACVVGVSAPYRLRGGMKTIEVLFTVRERANGPVKVQFVAHYHPDAGKAAPGSAYASQWHFKKWADAGGVRMDSMTDKTHPHLFPLVPKFGVMKKLNFAALPDTYPLYRPK